MVGSALALVLYQSYLLTAPTVAAFFSGHTDQAEPVYVASLLDMSELTILASDTPSSERLQRKIDAYRPQNQNSSVITLSNTRRNLDEVDRTSGADRLRLRIEEYGGSRSRSVGYPPKEPLTPPPPTPEIPEVPQSYDPTEEERNKIRFEEFFGTYQSPKSDDRTTFSVAPPPDLDVLVPTTIQPLGAPAPAERINKDERRSIRIVESAAQASGEEFVIASSADEAILLTDIRELFRPAAPATAQAAVLPSSGPGVWLAVLGAGAVCGVIRRRKTSK